MAQKVRHRNRAWVLWFLLIGCSTSNTESWVITSPTAGESFTMSAAEAQQNVKKITVTGTCSLADTANNMAVGDSNDNLVSGPYSITSGNNTTNSWTKADVILSKPTSASLPWGTYALKIVTGRPNPFKPTEVDSFTSVTISLIKPKPPMPGI